MAFKAGGSAVGFDHFGMRFSPDRNLGVLRVVASVAFDWFSVDHKMHYSGPGDVWWGADLAVVPRGKGRCIVSQLRLVENLGRDPVADRILLNLIEWTAGEGG